MGEQRDWGGRNCKRNSMQICFGNEQEFNVLIQKRGGRKDGGGTECNFNSIKITKGKDIFLSKT